MKKVTRARTPRRPTPLDVGALRFQVSMGGSLVEVLSTFTDVGTIAVFERADWRRLIRWLDAVEHWRAREKLKGRR